MSSGTNALVPLDILRDFGAHSAVLFADCGGPCRCGPQEFDDLDPSPSSSSLKYGANGGSSPALAALRLRGCVSKG